jgi:hypothetical protein
VNDWEVQLLIEAFKIVIFLAQVALLFLVVDRLRTVGERLEDTRRALVDLADRLPARTAATKAFDDPPSPQSPPRL